MIKNTTKQQLIIWGTRIGFILAPLGITSLSYWVLPWNLPLFVLGCVVGVTVWCIWEVGKHALNIELNTPFTPNLVPLLTELFPPDKWIVIFPKEGPEMVVCEIDGTEKIKVRYQGLQAKNNAQLRVMANWITKGKETK